MPLQVAISPRPSTVAGGDNTTFRAVVSDIPTTSAAKSFTLGTSRLNRGDVLGRVASARARVHYTWILTGPGRLSATNTESVTYFPPAAGNNEQPVSIRVFVRAADESDNDSISFVIPAKTGTGPAPTTDFSVNISGPSVLEGGKTGNYRITTTGPITHIRIRWLTSLGSINNPGASEIILTAPAATGSSQVIALACNYTVTLTGGITRTGQTGYRVTVPAKEQTIVEPTPDPTETGPYVRISPNALALAGSATANLIANVFNVPGVNDANLFTLGKSRLGGRHTLAGGAEGTPETPITYIWSSTLGEFDDETGRRVVFTAPPPLATVQNFSINVQATIGSDNPIVVRYAIAVAVAAHDGMIPDLPDPTIPGNIPVVLPPNPPVQVGTEKIDVVIDRNGEVIRYNGQDPTRWLRGPVVWRAGRVYDSRKLGRAAAGLAVIRLQNNDGEWNQVRSGDFVAIYIDGVSQWGGFVDVAKNEGRHGRVIRRLRCLGALAYLQDKVVHIPPSRNVSLPAAMNLVWESCGVPHRFRGSVNGSHVFPWFFIQGLAGKEAGHIIETTVRGFMFEDLDGKIKMNSFSDRQGTGDLIAIRNATATELNDNWERRIVAYQGFAINTEKSDTKSVTGLGIDHVDMPLTIPAESNMTLQIPRYRDENSVGLTDLLIPTAEDYTTVGNKTLTFSIRPHRNGVELVVQNPDSADTILTGIEIKGKHLLATAGVTQFKQSEPGTEPEQIPCHLIQNGGEVNQLMTSLLNSTSQGERVDELHWYGANDRALAKRLQIGGRLQSINTDAVYTIDGVDHEWRHGKIHHTRITTTRISDHSNLFTLGRSRLGGPATLL